MTRRREGRSATRERVTAAPRGPAAAAAPESVPVLASIALAAALLAYYLLLAPHTAADGDSAELTLVLVTGGVAHPTGYPLYSLLGHAFVAALRALGVGYAYAANAWSAVGGAVALVFVHRLALRLVSILPLRTRHAARAAVIVFALGFNPQWTAACTLTEVYSWHVAWVLGAALLFVRLVHSIMDRAQALPLVSTMLAWGFVCGTGGAHHSTAVFYAAAFTAGLTWALIVSSRWRAWIPLLWLGGGCIPLLSYAHLYATAHHPGAAAVWPALEPTLRGLVDHVSANVYRGFIGRWRPAPDQIADLTHYVAWFLSTGLILQALALVGIRIPSTRIVLASMLGASVLQFVFLFNYGVPDPASYFLAPLALSLTGWALLPPIRRRAKTFATVLAGAMVIALGVWNTGVALDRRRDVDHYDANIRSMWHAVPDERGIFLWASDSYYKVKLYQTLEGERTGMDVYDTAMLCKPHPEVAFTRKYGFDPLANNGPEHAGDTIAARYFSEHHELLDDRFLARVNETIADSAKVAVLLFNGERGTLKKLR